MATLQDIVNDNKTLTRSQLKADQGLVREIQTKLANLGLIYLDFLLTQWQ